MLKLGMTRSFYMMILGKSKKYALSLALVVFIFGITSLNAKFTDAEREHIYQISSNIKKTSDFIVQTLALLIEKQYTQSYRTFIDEFDTMLDSFENNVFKVLEQKLEQTATRDNVAFYEINREVYELMSEAFKNVKNARATFDSYRGKSRSAAEARDCLKTVEPHLRALILSDAFISLEKRLQKVYALLNEADEQDLIKEINTLETSLRSLENHPSFKQLTQQTLKLRLANMFTRMFEKGT